MKMKGHHHQQQQQQQQQQQHQHSPSPLPLRLPPPNKPRRCTALAAGVPALVVCSILLPLFFLLGLHRPGPGVLHAATASSVVGSVFLSVHDYHSVIPLLLL
jgi:alpha-1,4-galacturonosyltransferase